MSEKANKVVYIALSLLIAVLFWLFVDNEQGSKISETYYHVPVEFIGAEDVLPSRGLMLLDGDDITIDIKLSGPRLLMTRNLLYTAVTRARRLVVVVGREACMRAMVDNNYIDRRFSALDRRLAAWLTN